MRRLTTATPCLLLVALGALLLVSGCSSLGYLAHVTRGEAALLMHRRAVNAIVSDPRTSPELRRRLGNAEAARAFASDHLDLPRNHSYTSYVDLGRPYVTWNVFATPEFSVVPVKHCFPIAGCVAYLGFFEREQAEEEAGRLNGQGDDTRVEGVSAYSTLGWFADPLLSSMLRWDDDEVDGVIFHELAHQKVYAKGDTAFNESYATFVQQQGLREWRAARDLPPADARIQAHDAAFTRLVLDLRDHLQALYSRALPAADMRAAKQREILAFRACYARRRASIWSDDNRYDEWVARPINNAALVPFGLYDRWVPAFAELFQSVSGRWPAFYAQVQKLANLDKEDRDAALLRRPRGSEVDTSDSAEPPCKSM